MSPRDPNLYDPDLLQILGAALDDAWARLVESGSDLTAPDRAAATRDMLGSWIAMKGRHGVRDRAALAQGAINALSEPQGLLGIIVSEDQVASPHLADTRPPPDEPSATAETLTTDSKILEALDVLTDAKPNTRDEEPSSLQRSTPLSAGRQAIILPEQN